MYADAVRDPVVQETANKAPTITAVEKDLTTEPFSPE
jgi:hypothetical protein